MKSRIKTATLSDIAKKAGVSIATASRVLSGSNYPVKQEVKELVIKVAQELGYNSCSLFKLQANDDCRDIGVIIPTLTNPFYFELIAGIENECDRRGYTPIICSSKRDLQKEKGNFSLICKKKVKGIIISALNESPSFLSSILASSINVVVFDQAITNENISYVKFNYFEAGQLAAEYLLLRGHRRICFIAPPVTRNVRQEMFSGYKTALENFHVPFNPEYLLVPETEQELSNSMYDFDNGVEMAKRFLKITPRPTAIFTINDSTAYGCLKYFKEVGIKVPDDVSIIGCDNLNTSQIIDPALTTVHQPAYETGRLTCSILLDEIENKNDMKTRIDLRPSIIERASVRTI